MRQMSDSPLQNNNIKKNHTSNLRQNQNDVVTRQQRLRKATNLNLIEVKEKKIGNYKFGISSEIGRGYSSIVYKGYHIQTQEEVAIKVIDLREQSSPNSKMQEEELKILKTLDHPNVIKCYDIYKDQSYCYIITELCSQGDLYRFINKHKHIQQVAAINIMNQILKGVKYLMEKNIIHRDLKPSNIVKGKNGWKIADFGFAVKSSKLFRSKYNVGTPLYLPLQSLVDNVYSPKSDIFSVGIIFYQLLTGTTPWECRQEKELIQKLKTVPYSFPEKISVSPGIKEIIKSLCTAIYEQRMTKEEFMKLNLTYLIEKNDESSKAPIFLEATIKDQLKRNKSADNVCLKKSQQLSIDSKTEIKNNHILVNQLHYCRFIYYYIKNVKHLRVSSKNQIKLTLVMFKHLEKLILLLADKHNNYFKLEQWQSFRKSKKFISTNLTMKQYSSRYQQEYMNYLKDIDYETIQLINKNFPHLTQHQKFTENCYVQIMKFVSSLMREANHNLTFLTKNVEEPISSELKSGIEALKSLFKYYKLVNLSSKNFENYQFFERKSNIRVQIDFSSSDMRLEVYEAIREQLKFI